MSATSKTEDMETALSALSRVHPSEAEAHYLLGVLCALCPRNIFTALESLTERRNKNGATSPK